MHRKPYRYMFRRRRRLPSGVLPAILTLAAVITLLSYMSSQLRPIIKTLAESKAINLISLSVSEEVERNLAQEHLSYRDFIASETGTDGQITALAFKTAESSRFKRLVTESLIQRLENIDPDTLGIPLGNLTGTMFLSSLGPLVRVRVQSVGDVLTEYRNEFSSAGINQTRHSVYQNVSATVYLLIPGEIIPVEISEQVCVAETIIIGQVPDTYLNLLNGAK